MKTKKIRALELGFNLLAKRESVQICGLSGGRGKERKKEDRGRRFGLAIVLLFYYIVSTTEE